MVRERPFSALENMGIRCYCKNIQLDPGPYGDDCTCTRLHPLRRGKRSRPFRIGEIALRRKR